MTRWLNSVSFLLVLSLLLAGCASTPAGLLRPNGVAVAADGSLYVMDRGNYRVVHLTADGQELASFGRLGTAPDQIYSGWDTALDPQGNVYICNSDRDENGDITHDGVKVFSPSGDFLRQVGGQDYSYEETNATPYGLDVDAAGRVYVADFNLNTMRVFDAEGRLLGTFFGQTGSGPDEFNGLNDVAVDDVRGLLYICDSINSRIKEYALTTLPTGEITLTHRLTFGSYGSGPGQFSYPQYLAVDESTGRLYVNDMANYRLQIFDPTGQYLGEMTPPGVSAWQGMGLAVGEGGIVYNADALNNVIWAFGPDGRLLSRIELRP
jgi:DNA-binding beta-propeller fold protein YncE